jgi:hypothetical protein
VLRHRGNRSGWNAWPGERLERGLPGQCTGWVLLVEKEHACLQTALESGYIRKGLAFKSLPGDGLMMALNAGMLQRRSSMDEAHLHTQANQPKMDNARKRRGALVVVKGAIVIQAELLR